MNESHFQREDRDLLIAIDTKLTTLMQSNNDHETRLRRLELWGGIAIGGAYALQAYFNFIK